MIRPHLRSMSIVFALICIAVVSRISQGQTNASIESADSLFSLSKYKLAASQYEEVLSSHVGPSFLSDSLAADVYYNLGMCYRNLGKAAQSKRCFSASCDHYLTHCDSLTPRVAQTIYYLGATFLGSNYDSAGTLMKLSLELRERMYGADHAEVGRNLIGLIAVGKNTSRYGFAEECGLRAAEILDSQLDRTDTERAKPLVGLADLYRETGRYDESEKVLLRAIGIMDSATGLNHASAAPAIARLGGVKHEMGDYVAAESLYLNVSDIYSEFYGTDNYYYAENQFRLGQVYRAEDRLDDAMLHMETSLNSIESILGANHARVANCRSSLGRVYAILRHFEKAESLYTSAIQGLRDGGHGKGVHAAVAATNLAECHRIQGELHIADSLFRESLEIYTASLGDNHPYQVGSLLGLAKIAMVSGKTQHASEFLDAALEISISGNGPTHPVTAQTFEITSELATREKDYVRAAEYSWQALEIRRSNLVNGASVMSEADALKYSRFLRESLGKLLSVYIDMNDLKPFSNDELASAVIANKGVISDEIFERSLQFADGTDSVAAGKAKQLKLARSSLTRVFVTGSGALTDEQLASRDTLTRRIELLESDLARINSRFKERRTTKFASVGDVKGCLGPETSVVDYLKYDYQDLDADSILPRFLACVIQRDGQSVIIDIGTAVDVDAAVSEYRDHIQKLENLGRAPDSAELQEYYDIAGRLRELIWDPIRQQIKDTPELVISPDGALNLVSFSGLPLEAGRYLIEEHTICYVMASRDLVREAAHYNSGLLALGDPMFRMCNRLNSQSSNRIDSNVSESVSPSDCLDFGNLSIVRLPGTRTEVMNVTQIWSDRFSTSVDTLFASEATEKAFTQACRGKRAIHMATHGFYSPSQCYEPRTTSGSMNIDIIYPANPLALSGLFLAGASDGHNEPANDGILTASEVTSLDLSGTELVVLSACQSGMGDIVSGEGVYGLRRAFMMAGARNIVSSLWKASDAYTVTSIGQIYSEKAENSASALKRAALEQLSTLRKRGQPDHPFLWASFLVFGGEGMIDQ